MADTVLHLIRYLLGREPAESQTTVAERRALARHAAGRRVVAEIGVFEGLTSAVLARAMALDGTLYCIDPFFPGRIGICWGKIIAQREIARVRPRRNVVLLEKLSHGAVGDVRAELDFLFVDGDHSIEGITRDWADWSGKICSGGIVALHDTLVPAHNARIAELGSHRYFESHIRHDARFEMVERVDSLAVMRRKTK